MPALIHEAYQDFLKQDSAIREGVIKRYNECHIRHAEPKPGFTVFSKQELAHMRNLTPKELASYIADNITPAKRLEYMRSYVIANPHKAAEHDDYIQWLERLLNEEETSDYTNPATPYGTIMHFKAITEEEAIAELLPLGLKAYSTDDSSFTESQLREFYREIAGTLLPEIPSGEMRKMYRTGEWASTLLGSICEEWSINTQNVHVEYCYSHLKTAEYAPCYDFIEQALEEFVKESPDVQATICYALGLTLNDSVNVSE